MTEPMNTEPTDTVDRSREALAPFHRSQAMTNPDKLAPAGQPISAAKGVVA